MQRARELVLGEGWNTTSFQILNPGFRPWFSEAEDAVVGWVERRGVRVVAGAPICAFERLPGVVAEFEADARYARARVCYVAAQDRLVAALPTTSHRAIVVGAQPVLRPDAWDAVYRSHASLRAQVSRAQNKGLRATEWPAARGSDHPELKRCLDEWLAGRRLAAFRGGACSWRGARTSRSRSACFLPFRDGTAGSPNRLSAGDAPNGTAELLVDGALRAVAAEDATFFTLGGAFLSKRADTSAAERGLRRRGGVHRQITGARRSARHRTRGADRARLGASSRPALTTDGADDSGPRTLLGASSQTRCIQPQRSAIATARPRGMANDRERVLLTTSATTMRFKRFVKCSSAQITDRLKTLARTYSRAA